MASLLPPFLTQHFGWPSNPDEAHILLSTGVRRGPAHLWSTLVVSRRLMRHRCFPLGALPRHVRLSSIGVYMRAWTPFPNPSQILSLHEDGAAVLCWDRDRFDQALTEAGLKGAWFRILPETALLPPISDGVQMVRCLEGVDGQYWRGGALVASRFWDEPPVRGEWLNFLRGAGVPPEQQRLVQPTCGDLPDWSNPGGLRMVSLETLAGRETLWEHALAGALLLALLVPGAWLLRRDRWLNEETQSIAIRSAALSAEAAPLLESRRRFQEDEQTTKAILSVTTHPNALTLLAYLERTLLAGGGILRDVEWRESHLKVTVSPTSRASRLGLVKALEKDGWLLAAHEASDSLPDLLMLEARLAGATPPQSDIPKTEPP